MKVNEEIPTVPNSISSQKKTSGIIQRLI